MAFLENYSPEAFFCSSLRISVRRRREICSITFTTLISGFLGLVVTFALSSFLEEICGVIAFEHRLILQGFFSSDVFLAEDMLSPFLYLCFKIQYYQFVYLVVKFS